MELREFVDNFDSSETIRKYSFMSTRQKENPAFLQGRWLFDIDFCTLKS